MAIHCTGENTGSIHGNKITENNPGSRLIYQGTDEVATGKGKRVIHNLYDEKLKLKVESIYEFTNDIPVVRRWTVVTNEGDSDAGIKFVSSAMLNNYNLPGSQEEDEKLIYHYATNSWYEEAQWKRRRPTELGLGDNGRHHFTSFNVGSTGARSTISYLPMGMVENTGIGVTWFWQIEHSGSWYWETSNYSGESPTTSTWGDRTRSTTTPGKT